MREMHKKRRAPQLYLNETIDVEEEIRGNQFNQVLQRSLLAPMTERLLATRHVKQEPSQHSHSL